MACAWVLHNICNSPLYTNANAVACDGMHAWWWWAIKRVISCPQLGSYQDDMPSLSHHLYHTNVISSHHITTINQPIISMVGIIVTSCQSNDYRVRRPHRRQIHRPLRQKHHLRRDLTRIPSDCWTHDYNHPQHYYITHLRFIIIIPDSQPCHHGTQ